MFWANWGTLKILSGKVHCLQESGRNLFVKSGHTFTSWFCKFHFPCVRFSQDRLIRVASKATSTWASQQPRNVDKRSLAVQDLRQDDRTGTITWGVGSGEVQTRHLTMADAHRRSPSVCFSGKKCLVVSLGPGFHATRTVLEVKGTTDEVVPNHRQPFLPIAYEADSKGPHGDPRMARSPWLSLL